MDILDVFYNNDNSIDNEADVRNNVPAVDKNYGVICDRSNDSNHPPLPLESLPYNIIMPCIYSTNITNDVEVPQEKNICLISTFTNSDLLVN